MNIRDKLADGWIHSNIIIEILGKPPAYVDKIIKEVVESIKKIEGIEVINANFHEPREAKTLFSTFAEIELIAQDIMKLTELVFNYMPSNIEIIEPENMKIDLVKANDFFNMLASKLHAYDSSIKGLKFETLYLKKTLEKAGLTPKQPAQEIKPAILEETKEKKE
ncbi:hypothetical protein ACFLZZ_02965 [Nanoarchaeota archaeon]